MPPTPEALLAQIACHTWTRLAPSSIHGIGVFAIRQIPVGINPFASEPHCEYVRVPPEKIASLHPEVQRLLTDLCVFEEGVYWVPDFGLTGAGQGWYLNHSSTPNMSTPPDGEEHGDEFFTLREIEPGEELTIDYGTYNDPSNLSGR